ncbi:MAG: hypothetical protein AAGK22_23470 [Acidobacteriota bacterium]
MIWKTSHFTDFERAALSEVVSRHHEVEHLSHQVRLAQATARDLTGAGLYLDLKVPRSVRLIENPKNRELGGLEAVVPGLRGGIGFYLFVRDGVLSWLEAFTYQEPYPDTIEDWTWVHW